MGRIQILMKNTNLEKNLVLVLSVRISEFVTKNRYKVLLITDIFLVTYFYEFKLKVNENGHRKIVQKAC